MSRRRIGIPAPTRRRHRPKLAAPQIYCRPTYEVMEVYAMDIKQAPLSIRNMIGRFVVTTIYCVLVTLVGAML